MEGRPVKDRAKKTRKAKAVRVRFEVAGRRYEGTLGEVTERYTAERRRAGVDWPGGVSPRKG